MQVGRKATWVGPSGWQTNKNNLFKKEGKSTRLLIITTAYYSILLYREIMMKMNILGPFLRFLCFTPPPPHRLLGEF
jgi:hypothetical protein